MLIQEISEMRALIRLVSLRARVAVLEGHIDDAFHWIQTGFAMARHASQGPLLIQSLVGVSLSQTMSRPLEDLIQAPGAPNLFWALSHRPRPLTDFSAGFESERFLLEKRDSVASASSTALPGAWRRGGNSRPSCKKSSSGLRRSPMVRRIPSCGTGRTDWAWPAWFSRFIPRPSAP